MEEKEKTAARVRPVRAALAGMVSGSAVLQKESGSWDKRIQTAAEPTD